MKKILLGLVITLVLFSMTIAGGQDYIFDGKWGEEGAGEGEFKFPRGVAIDTTGNVYVADVLNHRIQKFDAAGNYLIQWGSEGMRNGEFKAPHGVAVDTAGNVYVADRGNHRIQKFDLEGKFIRSWGRIQKFGPERKLQLPVPSRGSGDGEFQNPTDVAVDTAGNFYVADSWNHRVQKFNSKGNFVRSWGRLPVPSRGSGDGEFENPTDVAVDTAGNMYVVDRNNSRVQKFDLHGNYKKDWEIYSELSLSGIAVDSAGNVYVGDKEITIIRKFDSNGNYITHWGREGSGDGEFIVVQGIAVDRLGKVYVADVLNHRIQKFKPVLTLMHERLGFPAPTTTTTTSTVPGKFTPPTLRQPYRRF